MPIEKNEPEKKPRIVFAGTSDFAEYMLNSLLSNHHDVLAVYTQPDRPKGRGRHISYSPVKNLALRYRLPVYQPARFNELAIRQICALSADLMIVAAYGLLIPETVLKHFPYGCLNVHASLLPKWRGASPIQQAILSGESKTGISIMQMVKQLDEGPVLLQETCSIHAKETMGTLSEKLACLGATALEKALGQLEYWHPVAQDPRKVSYAPKLFSNMAEIHWNRTAVELDRLIRALNPKPVAYTYWGKRRLKLWIAEPLVQKNASVKKSMPGCVVALSAHGLDVATKEGLLRISELQLEGRSKVLIPHFFNAYRQQILVGKTQLG